MDTKDFVELSTRVTKDLKAWVDQAQMRHELSADQLTTIDAAALIVEGITLRVVRDTLPAVPVDPATAP